MSLKKKVADLEKEINELRRQLLELALQPRVGSYTYIPYEFPKPYTNIPDYPTYPIVTCGTSKITSGLGSSDCLSGIQSKQNLS